MTVPHVLDQAGDDDRLDQGEGAWRTTPERYLEENPPGYDGWRRASCYVAVRDGTRIAVDVHLPFASDEDERFNASEEKPRE